VRTGQEGAQSSSPAEAEVHILVGRSRPRKSVFVHRFYVDEGIVDFRQGLDAAAHNFSYLVRTVNRHSPIQGDV
jgi:hypothetical protein